MNIHILTHFCWFNAILLQSTKEYSTMENFYSFSAISGIQARQSYFTLNIPLSVVAKIFSREQVNLPADKRSQRIANQTRINNIAQYIINNPNTYIIPPLVAYVRSGEVKFIPNEGTVTLGTLHVDFDSDFALYDGQHRCEGIKLAIKERPLLANETVTIFLLPHANLSSAQQIFADINMNAVQPAKSIKLLYNQRDAITAFTKSMIEQFPIFSDLTDLERTNLASNSPMLFTFSGVHQVNKILWKAMGDSQAKPILITKFWEACMNAIPEWEQVHDHTESPESLREKSLAAHSITWAALAEVGAYLYEKFAHNDQWIEHINRISLDFNRDNPIWNRRVLNVGKITKGQKNILLMANVILKNINIEPPTKQKELEINFLQQLEKEKQESLFSE